MNVAISFGSILLAAFVFYFVIKWAVKAGINESYLFSGERRKQLELEELEETYKSIGVEVPDYIKEHYEKK